MTIRWPRLLRTGLLILALAPAALLLEAHAAESKRTTAVALDIQPQPLGTALNAFARQSGLRVIFFSEISEGMQAPRVAGTLTPEAALGRLLANTPLHYEFVDDGTVAIKARRGQAEVGAATTSDVASGAETNSSRLAQAMTRVEEQNTSAAKSAESEGALTQEIIVSAQRRDERLIDTPISIGVLSGADLDRGSSRGASDVLNSVGGVSLIENAPGNNQISIRGVVSGAGTSTTGYYLDEVPFAFITATQLPDANAFDLSRIEVLRGPQGTLYGANALSGVVRILTNDAQLNKFEAKGRVRVSDTSHGSENFGGDLAFNVPVVQDKLAIRAMVSYSDLSGYIDSPSAGAKGVNDTQAQAYRLKATYQATEALGIKLAYSRSRLDNGSTPQSFDDFTIDGPAIFSTNQPDDRTYDTYNAIVEYAWDNVSLLSSTSYFDYRADSRYEIRFDPSTLNYFNRYDLSSFSQELRLVSRDNGGFLWSAGGIYKDVKQAHSQDARPSAILPEVYGDRNVSESYAFFGELTQNFADGKFALTGGARYFRDELRSQETGDFFGRPLTPPRSAEFDDVTGRVVFTYKPNQTRMMYGSIATGFRSGLNQSSAVRRSNPDFAPVKPDSLVTYEVGAKGAFGDGRFGYDTAVYYTDWKDVQQSLIVPAGFVALVNAGKANGIGADASLAYQPAENFEFQVAVGWNDLSFNEQIVQAGVVLFPKGGRLNNSPEVTGSVGGTYRVPTALSDLTAFISANYTYSSKLILRYLTGSAVTEAQSDNIDTLKLSLGVEKAGWSAQLFADNLLDERGRFAPPNNTVWNQSVRIRPRTFGLQMAFSY